MISEVDTQSLPVDYIERNKEKIENLIEKAKLNEAIHVDANMVLLYWNIGNDIIRKERWE